MALRRRCEIKALKIASIAVAVYFGVVLIMVANDDSGSGYTDCRALHKQIAAMFIAFPDTAKVTSCKIEDGSMIAFYNTPLKQGIRYYARFGDMGGRSCVEYIRWNYPDGEPDTEEIATPTICRT